jgi:hypothetical protein
MFIKKIILNTMKMGYGSLGMAEIVHAYPKTKKKGGEGRRCRAFRLVVLPKTFTKANPQREQPRQIDPRIGNMIKSGVVKVSGF